MRSLLTILMSIALASAVSAQGIEFFDGSFDEAKAEAARTGRPIFMDAYASWCGPCKMMSRNVFTQEQVGDFFNANFVNLKVDMEKGEGIQLRRTYGVSAYPTLLFLNDDGSVIESVRGARGAQALIDLGRKAVEPDPSDVDEMTARFDDGERDPAFLMEYARMVELGGGDAGPIEDALIASLSDEEIVSEDHIDRVFDRVDAAGSPAYDALLDNREAFTEHFGEDAVNTRLAAGVEESVTAAGMANDKKAFKKALKAYKKLKTGDFREKKAFFTALYHGAGQRWGDYDRAVGDYLESYAADDASAWNEVAWNFYALVDDPALLSRAERFARRAVELDPSGTHYKTLAFLQMKQKNYAVAAETAAEAEAAFGQGTEEGEAMKALGKALVSRAEAAEAE